MATEKSSNDKKALNPTVLRLGWVSLFADIASEMLYPITPIFLTSLMGVSMMSLGLIEGAAEAMASLLKGAAGAWSDRIHKRKVFIWVGYLLAAVAKPLLGLATIWPHALLARCLDRTGKGLRTAPRDALIADATHESVRGAAFGWHRLMDTAGAAIGPLLALFLLKVVHLNNLRAFYFIAFTPGLISVLLALSIPEKKPTKAVKKLPKISFFALPKNFKHFLFAWGLFAFTNSSDVFLIMKARREGLSIPVTILLYCFYNLVYALLSPSLGKISDRIGRKSVLLAGLVVFAGVYLGFDFATVLRDFVILFGIYGVYMAATEGVTKALAVDLMPAELKASAVGYLGMITGLGTLIASATAGLLWDKFGPQTAFIFSAAGAVLAFAFLVPVRMCYPRSP